MSDRISDKAKRLINTFADQRGGGLTRTHKQQLSLTIGSDPQAAYDYCCEQSQRDWEDRRFASKLANIGRWIMENYPIKG